MSQAAWAMLALLSASACGSTAPDQAATPFDAGTTAPPPDEALADAGPAEGTPPPPPPEATSLLELAEATAVRPYAAAPLGTTGDVLLVGADKFGSANGDRNAVALRLDLAGDVKWAKRFSGDSNDQFLVLASGGMMLDAFGVTRTAFTGGTQNTDVLWVQLDAANGSTVASRHFGTTTNDDVFGAVAQADGIVLSGHVGDGEDAYVSKLAAAGTVTWARRWSTPGTESLRWLAPVQDGVVAAGFSSLAAGGKSTPVLSKLDAAGAHVWSRQIVGLVDDGRFLTGAVSAGGYVLAGEIVITTGGPTVPFAMKVSIDGSTIAWAKAYAGGGGSWRSAQLVPPDDTYALPETVALGGFGGGAARVARISTSDGSVVAALGIATAAPDELVSDREVLFPRSDGGFGFFFRTLPDTPKLGFALPNRLLALPATCAAATKPALGGADVAGLTSVSLAPTVANLAFTVAPNGAAITASDLTTTKKVTCN